MFPKLKYETVREINYIFTKRSFLFKTDFLIAFSLISKSHEVYIIF